MREAETLSRRVPLPGAEELFGSSRRPAREPATEPAATPDRSATVNARMLATVRQLTAAEDAPLAAARQRAEGRLHPPSPEVGSLLRWAAVHSDARAVVEVGSAGGVSGLWLLSGLPRRSVVTSIEPDPDAHALATEAFQSVEAGTRVRAILGDAATVLPRLADGGYDLVVLQGPASGYPADLAHARRLLRAGGVLVARHVLQAGEHAQAVAEAVEDLAADRGFSAVVLPIDDGVAMATRLGGPTEA